MQLNQPYDDLVSELITARALSNWYVGPASYLVRWVVFGDACHITMHEDTAAAIAGDDEAFGARMLGHLIAHEVGHLLLGQGSHSKKGIMLGDWLQTDLEKAAQGRLLFTDRQAKKMRRAVRQRSRIESAD